MNMLKKFFAIMLVLVASGLAQTHMDTLVAQRLAMDTVHAYNLYYEDLVESERSQEGIASNVFGIVLGTALTAVGGLLVATGDEGFWIPGIPCAVVGSYFLFSNISGIGESRMHAQRRKYYEDIYGLYREYRKAPQASSANDTSMSSFAIDSLVAEQLALDPSYAYNAHFIDRIKTEFSQESVAENLFGILVGGGIVTLGVIGLSVETSDDIEKALATIIGVPLIASGGSVLIYNIYAVGRDLGHKRKRKEFERAYELYKNRRKDSGLATNFFLTPTFNVATLGPGMNLLVTF